MAQVTWDLEHQTATAVFSDPEMTTIREALRRDPEFLRASIMETLVVLARNFNEQAIREAVHRAKLGSQGQFGPLGSMTLA